MKTYFSKLMMGLGALLLLSAALLSGCAPSARTASDTIVQRINTDPILGPHVITVQVRDGIATLNGEVASERDRLIVYNTARYQPGVDEVRDYLQVRDIRSAPLAMMSPEMLGMTELSLRDRQLLTDIQTNLIPISRQHSYRLSLLVRDGFVTASGTAASRADADAVLAVVRRTPGVLGVSDRIGITPPLSDEALSRILQATFASDSDINLKELTYNVQGGVVTFTGRVNRHEDIDRVLAQTLNTPGVVGIRSTVSIGKVGR